METDLTDTCWECGKRITADEAVVNWLSCSECWDADYAKYRRKNWLKIWWQDFISRFRKDEF